MLPGRSGECGRSGGKRADSPARLPDAADTATGCQPTAVRRRPPTRRERSKHGFFFHHECGVGHFGQRGAASIGPSVRISTRHLPGRRHAHGGVAPHRSDDTVAAPSSSATAGENSGGGVAYSATGTGPHPFSPSALTQQPNTTEATSSGSVPLDAAVQRGRSPTAPDDSAEAILRQRDSEVAFLSEALTASQRQRAEALQGRHEAEDLAQRAVGDLRGHVASERSSVRDAYTERLTRMDEQVRLAQEVRVRWPRASLRRTIVDPARRPHCRDPERRLHRRRGRGRAPRARG